MVVVRTVTEADLALLEERWPVPGGVHAGHLRAQEYGGATFLAAWSGDEPVGSAMVQWGGPVGTAARAAYPGTVEINHLQVREAHRGSGVGTAIIAAAEELCLARGRRHVAVGVSLDNEGAARLYERLGYRQTGVVDTSEYDWFDDDGTVRHAVEQDQLLVKDL